MSYEHTYPYLVWKTCAASHHEVLTNSAWGRTLTDTIPLMDYLLLFTPTWMVMHLGIVDCAPRVFSRTEHALLERLRPVKLRNGIIGAAGRYRRLLLTLRRGLVYTRPKRFESAAQRIAAQARGGGVKLLWVLIAPPNTGFRNKSPGIDNNINPPQPAK